MPTFSILQAQLGKPLDPPDHPGSHARVHQPAIHYTNIPNTVRHREVLGFDIRGGETVRERSKRPAMSDVKTAPSW